jgi:hypothetical protein
MFEKQFLRLKNQHVTIHGRGGWYIKQVNDYQDYVLMKVEDENYSSVANLSKYNSQCFTMTFMYHGISCMQKIRYSDVEIA